MALGYVVAICSERRLRLLPERSAYVIAGDERGQLVSSCGTRMYGRIFRKSPVHANCTLQHYCMRINYGYEQTKSWNKAALTFGV
jgi:hypothetical protein